MGLARDLRFRSGATDFFAFHHAARHVRFLGNRFPELKSHLERLGRSPSSVMVRPRAASRLCLGLRGPGAGCAGVVTGLTRWLPSDSEVNTARATAS